MKEIINDVLLGSSFESVKRFEFGELYQNSQIDVFYYWLVVHTDTLTPELISSLQDEYFDECKKVVDSPSFNKNTSLLILYETNPLEIIKGLVQLIEEDPYQFKKYVIPYTNEALSDLKDQVKTEIYENLKLLISDNSVFQDYKSDYNNYNWRHLLYSVAHKLPFLELLIEENQSIANMDEMSKELIERDNLREYYLKLNEFIVGEDFINLQELNLNDLIKKIEE
ncbi:MAG: ABC-three component system middle component 1 [Melioribacteraceae bacterium]|nr:ABC-three component system middle component 1 [Melioribacteraceae bacterium]